MKIFTLEMSTVIFPDRCEWKSGYEPNIKGGLIRHTDYRTPQSIRGRCSGAGSKFRSPLERNMGSVLYGTGIRS
jgi:hypothetical protein